MLCARDLEVRRDDAEGFKWNLRAAVVRAALSHRGQNENAHRTLGGIPVLFRGNNDERSSLRQSRQPRRSLHYVVPVESDLAAERAIGAEAGRSFNKEATGIARIHEKLRGIG